MNEDTHHISHRDELVRVVGLIAFGVSLGAEPLLGLSLGQMNAEMIEHPAGQTP